MSFISLADTKAHLRVTGTAEDTLIQKYIDAAEAYVENYLNDAIAGIADSPQNVPEDIQAAGLLLVHDMFENRNGASDKELKRNPTVDNMLFFHRKQMGI